MEILGLLAIVAIVTFFLPWVNAARLSSLRRELDEVRAELRAARMALQPARQAERQEPQEIYEEPEPALDMPVTDKPDIKAPAPPASHPFVPPVRMKQMQKARDSFERNLGTKIPVWLGALSLIFAAFFLVKYSIETGWLGPIARISLGGAFGAMLLAAGQWIVRRDHIANAERIAQGLIGAGLVSLYVSLYAAVNLYDLLSPTPGFIAMAGVTGLAVILSLRHGQSIAVFGLIGGLLTPALVGAEAPNAATLFTYLFLLFTGVFYVLSRQGWWLLAIAALLGMFCWAGYWFAVAFVAADAFVMVLFAMALSVVVMVMTGRVLAGARAAPADKRPVHALNFVAIAGAVLTIGWLGFEVALGLFDWAMLGLLSLGLMVMAWFSPDIYRRPLWGKLAAMLALFCLWAEGASLERAVTVVGGLAVIYAVLPGFLMRKTADPRFWAGLQCLSAVSLYIVSYLVLDLPEWFTVPFGHFWGVISLLFAGFAVWQAATIREFFNADEVVREHLVATYALAASAFIALGLSIELPLEYLPLAFAAQIAATAWVYRQTGIMFLRKIIVALTVILGGLLCEQFVLFGNIIMAAILDEDAGRRYASRAVLDLPLIKLGVPAILSSYAAMVAVQGERGDSRFVKILFSAAMLLWLATFYYLARGAFYESYDLAFKSAAGFLERGFITAGFAVLGAALIAGGNRVRFEYMRLWGYSLLHFVMLRIVYFDVLLLNPAFERGQLVGDWPLVNGVTMTYGLGALLAAWIVFHRSDAGFLRSLYKGLGFVLLFFLSSLTVRQLFHGSDLVTGYEGAAEFYSYSLAWLLTGLGLLAAGIRMDNKSARLASLVFMVLTIGKVFIFDAAALEGLYRVASFLGLGISLIGLSYFYTKFVFAAESKDKNTVL